MSDDDSDARWTVDPLAPSTFSLPADPPALLTAAADEAVALDAPMARSILAAQALTSQYSGGFAIDPGQYWSPTHGMDVLPNTRGSYTAGFFQDTIVRQGPTISV